MDQRSASLRQGPDSQGILPSAIPARQTYGTTNPWYTDCAVYLRRFGARDDVTVHLITVLAVSILISSEETAIREPALYNLALAAIAVSRH